MNIDKRAEQGIIIEENGKTIGIAQSKGIFEFKIKCKKKDIGGFYGRTAN